MKSLCGHENVLATLVDFKDRSGQKVGEHLNLSLSGDKLVEFKFALSKALNTWDTGPGWMFELDSLLNGIPAPFDARKNSKQN